MWIAAVVAVLELNQVNAAARESGPVAVSASLPDVGEVPLAVGDD